MMTEIPEHLKGPPLPEIMRKYPPVPIYAYVHSHPNEQVMGVVIDGRNGYVIEAVILPTKQRVMLGLGVGNEEANAHHIYRRKFPHGYKLEWSDNPETDSRLRKLKGRLEEDQEEFRNSNPIKPEPDPVRTASVPDEDAAPLGNTGQLTAELMQGGVEQAKSIARSARRSDDSNRAAHETTTPDPAQEQLSPGAVDIRDGDKPTNKPNLGGFFW